MLSFVAQTRAEDAAVGAIVSPLLEFPIDQAAGVIFNIVGGLDMSLTEASLLTLTVDFILFFAHPHFSGWPFFLVVATAAGAKRV